MGRGESSPRPGVRLQKILAAAGVGSRRSCEELIRQGRVLLNGKKVSRLGILADPERDGIRVDGRKIPSPPPRKSYYLLNKPRGFLSTLSDPEGRPTVKDLLKGIRERVFPVGRLDWDTEGLLILTNDGDLAQAVAHPSRGCPKYYQVKVQGFLSEGEIRRLERGIWWAGKRSRIQNVHLLARSRTPWYELVLREGRKNQIRKLFQLLGHPVVRLRRVAIGPVRDRTLPEGTFRRLTPGEVRNLWKAGAGKTQGGAGKRTRSGQGQRGGMG